MKIITTLLLGFILIFSSCKNVKNISEPEFRDISNVHVVDVGILKTTAGADMIYFNPNDAGIRLSAARGDLYVDNTYFGSFELADEVQVRKQSEFILPVIIKIDNINAIKNQGDIYKKKQVMVRIEGNALAKKAGFSREIPVHFEQMVDVDRLRALVTR